MEAPKSTTERSIRIKLKPSTSFLERLNIESLEESPSVAVPSILSKSGLTTVVQHFLNELSVSLPTNTTLEFYDIQRETLIKGTLEKHLKKYHITEEDVLYLEYSFPRSSNFLEEGPGAPVPDWISCLTRFDDQVFAGSFDGSIISSKYQTGAGLTVNNIEESAHSAQITGIASFQANNSKVYCAASSKDDSISIRKLIEKENKFDSSIIATCCSMEGHSLETVCAANSSDNDSEILLASGGFSKNIYFFQAPLDGQINDDNSMKIQQEEEEGKKRMKNNSKETILVKPSCILRGHLDKVSECVWGSKIDPVTLYSGSFDHTLRVWDCIRQVETCVLQSQKPFTTIDFLPSRQLVASGHPDHVIRLWDARAGGDAVSKLNLKGHRGWISGVEFEGGDNSNFLASVSYDRTCRIWDIRGGVPLQTIQTDVNGRLFTVTWGKNSTIHLGGTDSVLRTYTVKV